MAKENQSVEVGSAFDLLPKSLEIVKKNWLAFALVNIFSIIASIFTPNSTFGPAESTDGEVKFSDALNGMFPGLNIESFSSPGVFLVALFLIVNIFLYLMMVVLEVRASTGDKPNIPTIASETLKSGFKLLVLIFISALIIIVGLILFIIPGIIAIGRLAMSPYVMIDKNLGIMESIRESNKLGRAYFGKVWGAIGVLILIGIGATLIGIFPIVGALVGTIVTIAYSMVLALRYQQLKNLK